MTTLSSAGCSQSRSETHDQVHVVDGNIAILGGCAEVFGITEIFTEEVDGGDQITEPITSSGDVFIGVLPSCSKVWHSADDPVNGRLEHRDEGQSSSQEVLNHRHVTGHIACERWSV